jgi:hypothetical protein
MSFACETWRVPLTRRCTLSIWGCFPGVFTESLPGFPKILLTVTRPGAALCGAGFDSIPFSNALDLKRITA